MIGPGKPVTHRMGRRLKGWSGRRGTRRWAFLLICVGLALTLGVAALLASSAPSAPSFARARSYATGRAPHSVAIGDLNGDGKPDLATANDVAGTVSVLLNRGDGRLQAKHDYRAGARPESVAIGDLTGDGKPDMAIANVPGEHRLCARQWGRRQVPAEARLWHWARSALGHDRRPEQRRQAGSRHRERRRLHRLRPSEQRQRKLPSQARLRNRTVPRVRRDRRPERRRQARPGDGERRRRREYRLGAPEQRGRIFRAKSDYRDGSYDAIPSSVALGDLNGDGKPDLATANSGDYTNANTVSVLLGRGDGSFRAKREYVVGRGPYSLAIGDLNGDGNPDLATSHHGEVAGTVFVLLNRGDGTFQDKLDYRLRSAPLEVALGDLNGDRKPDLATTNRYANTVSVLLNKPGLCTVQNVHGMTVAAAKRTIARANCRVGKIRRTYSKVKRGRVISQKPRFGAVLRGGGKVNLVVSRGRKPS